MSRTKKVCKVKEKIELDDHERQNFFQVAFFFVKYMSEQSFDNVKKTKDVMSKLLEFTKAEAEINAIVYDPAGMDKRDLYCLQEINNQSTHEYHGQHQRLLLNAILIAAYSALEHILSTLAHFLSCRCDVCKSRSYNFQCSLNIIAKVDLQLDEALIKKANTLRVVRNILVHANGEYVNQKSSEIAGILKATEFISRGFYGRLDIRAEYIDDSLDCIDRIVSSLKLQLHEKLFTH